MSVRTWFWEIASEDIQNEAETLRTTIKTLSVDIAGAARGLPLIAEADIQDLRYNTRQMLANVRFNQYHHSGVYVHHDEGLCWASILHRRTNLRLTLRPRLMTCSPTPRPRFST